MKLPLALVLAGLLAGSAQAQKPDFPTPAVAGPITFGPTDGSIEHDYPFFSDRDWLERQGYVEEEFFLEGTANRYDRESGAILSSGHAYKTRLLVRRPARAEAHNGIVLLEWQNVTAGYDLDFLWSSFRRHLVRHGYVWIGISAQQVGVNALREWSPSRYGSLDVTAAGTITDDSLSYDIFGQAARVLRAPRGSAADSDNGPHPLGDLTARILIGEGASQSAGRLVPFFNLAQNHHQPVIDVLFLSIGGSETRADPDIPVFRLLTETDVLGRVSRGIVDPVDSDMQRTWEIAGTSHSGWAGFTERQEVVERDLGRPMSLPACEKTPYARVPQEKVYHAAFAQMAYWAETGTPPPTAPRLERDGQDLARDEYGNVKGGIRLAEHAVPTARNDGINQGENRFCRLYGSHEPFDQATLQALYPTHAGYVARVAAATYANAEMGYVLLEDAVETERQAIVSTIGSFPPASP